MSKNKPIFVIQKHDATSLHYDFRLEIDGKLKSWSVPKGPSTDPSEKRLAIETEDHDMKYADFEGVIPEGKYGAGTVMLWDKGTFKNERDDEKSLKKSYDEGKIEVWLDGEKIKGGYALIKTKNDWLLIKKKDEEADARRNPTGTQNKSVKSDRTLNQIRKEEE